jgi:hypothetical protein
LVRSDYRSIDDGANVIDLELQLLEYPEPSPAIGPVGEPVVDGFPRAEALRQITPRNACFRPVQDCIDELSVTKFGSRPLPLFRKQLAKPSPLLVGQGMSVHRQLGSHP